MSKRQKNIVLVGTAGLLGLLLWGTPADKSCDETYYALETQNTSSLSSLSTNTDVNGDGNTNIQDVVLLVQFVLASNNPSANDLEMADLNDDAIINVLDIIFLINSILYEETEPNVLIAYEPRFVMELFPQGRSHGNVLQGVAVDPEEETLYVSTDTDGKDNGQDDLLINRLS